MRSACSNPRATRALKQRASEAEKVATEAKETAARGEVKGKTMYALDKADDYFHKMGSDPDTPGDYDTPAAKAKTALEKYMVRADCAAAKSAIDAGSRAAGDALQWFKDQKDKPAAWEQDLVTPANKAVGAVGPQ